MRAKLSGLQGSYKLLVGLQLYLHKAVVRQFVLVLVPVVTQNFSVHRQPHMGVLTTVHHGK